MLTLLLARQSDTAALRRLALSASDDTTDALRVFVRWRTAHALRDERALTRVRREFDRAPNAALRSIAMTSQFDGASIDDGDRAVEILRGRALSDAEKIDVELARHSRALNSDDYATALARTRVWARRNRRSTRSLRLRVLDALYSNGDRAAAVAAADRLSDMVSAARPATAPDSALRLADVCVLGQWRLATHDTTAARAGGSHAARRECDVAALSGRSRREPGDVRRAARRVAGDRRARRRRRAIVSPIWIRSSSAGRRWGTRCAMRIL